MHVTMNDLFRALLLHESVRGKNHVIIIVIHPLFRSKSTILKIKYEFRIFSSVVFQMILTNFH